MPHKLSPDFVVWLCSSTMKNSLLVCKKVNCKRVHKLAANSILSLTGLHFLKLCNFFCDIQNFNQPSAYLDFFLHTVFHLMIYIKEFVFSCQTVMYFTQSEVIDLFHQLIKGIVLPSTFLWGTGLNLHIYSTTSPGQSRCFDSLL